MQVGVVLRGVTGVNSTTAFVVLVSSGRSVLWQAVVMRFQSWLLVLGRWTPCRSLRLLRFLSRRFGGR